MKKEYLIGAIVGVVFVTVMEIIGVVLFLKFVIPAANTTLEDVQDTVVETATSQPAKSSGTASKEVAPDVITVNGKPLSTFQMIALKAAAGDTEIPPGDYWYDSDTGEFGMVGEAALGTGPTGLEL